MNNKGCAFEMKGGGTSRYFASPAVKGFADFVRFLYENGAARIKRRARSRSGYRRSWS